MEKQSRKLFKLFLIIFSFFFLFLSQTGKAYVSLDDELWVFFSFDLVSKIATTTDYPDGIPIPIDFTGGSYSFSTSAPIPYKPSEEYSQVVLPEGEAEEIIVTYAPWGATPVPTGYLPYPPWLPQTTEFSFEKIVLPQPPSPTPTEQYAQVVLPEGEEGYNLVVLPEETPGPRPTIAQPPPFVVYYPGYKDFDKYYFWYRPQWTKLKPTSQRLTALESWGYGAARNIEPKLNATASYDKSYDDYVYYYYDGWGQERAFVFKIEDNAIVKMEGEPRKDETITLYKWVPYGWTKVFLPIYWPVPTIVPYRYVEAYTLNSNFPYCYVSPESDPRSPDYGQVHCMGKIMILKKEVWEAIEYDKDGNIAKYQLTDISYISDFQEILNIVSDVCEFKGYFEGQTPQFIDPLYMETEPDPRHINKERWNTFLTDSFMKDFYLALDPYDKIPDDQQPPWDDMLYGGPKEYWLDLFKNRAKLFVMSAASWFFGLDFLHFNPYPGPSISKSDIESLFRNNRQEFKENHYEYLITDIRNYYDYETLSNLRTPVLTCYNKLKKKEPPPDETIKIRLYKKESNMLDYIENGDKNIDFFFLEEKEASSSFVQIIPDYLENYQNAIGFAYFAYTKDGELFSVTRNCNYFKDNYNDQLYAECLTWATTTVFEVDPYYYFQYRNEYFSDYFFSGNYLKIPDRTIILPESNKNYIRYYKPYVWPYQFYNSYINQESSSCNVIRKDCTGGGGPSRVDLTLVNSLSFDSSLYYIFNLSSIPINFLDPFEYLKKLSDTDKLFPLYCDDGSSYSSDIDYGNNCEKFVYDSGAQRYSFVKQSCCNLLSLKFYSDDVISLIKQNRELELKCYYYPKSFDNKICKNDIDVQCSVKLENLSTSSFSSNFSVSSTTFTNVYLLDYVDYFGYTFGLPGYVTYSPLFILHDVIFNDDLSFEVIPYYSTFETIVEGVGKLELALSYFIHVLNEKDNLLHAYPCQSSSISKSGIYLDVPTTWNIKIISKHIQKFATKFLDHELIPMVLKNNDNEKENKRDFYIQFSHYLSFIPYDYYYEHKIFLDQFIDPETKFEPLWFGYQPFYYYNGYYLQDNSLKLKTFKSGEFQSPENFAEYFEIWKPNSSMCPAAYNTGTTSSSTLAKKAGIKGGTKYKIEEIKLLSNVEDLLGADCVNSDYFMRADYLEGFCAFVVLSNGNIVSRPDFYTTSTEGVSTDYGYFTLVQVSTTSGKNIHDDFSEECIKIHENPQSIYYYGSFLNSIATSNLTFLDLLTPDNYPEDPGCLAVAKGQIHLRKKPLDFRDYYFYFHIPSRVSEIIKDNKVIYDSEREGKKMGWGKAKRVERINELTGEPSIFLSNSWIGRKYPWQVYYWGQATYWEMIPIIAGGYYLIMDAQPIYATENGYAFFYFFPRVNPGIVPTPTPKMYIWYYLPPVYFTTVQEILSPPQP